MMKLAWLLVLLAAPLLAADTPADEVGKDLHALEGTWTAVGLEARGMSFPKEQVPSFTIVVAAEGKAIGRTPEEEFRFTMVIDPRKSPKQIENRHETGKQQGMRQYGIYRLEQDRFTVCMTRPGRTEADRPKSFDTRDTTNVVFVFERAKPAAPPKQ